MIRNHTAFAIAAIAFAAVAGSAVAAPVTFLEKQQAGEWLAHRLVGTKVLNSQAEEIGSVKDVVVDKAGTVTAVVVGVGGFLGIPEKLVAVPVNQIHIGDVVQSSRVVVLDATKEALKAAPTYSATDPAMPDRVKQKASDWMAAAKAKVMDLSKAASEKAKEMTAPKDGAAPAPSKP
ncbi:MAG: PRC-barrel domain-containing protein [Hyphomicrobiaceae bacterium]